MLGETLRTTDYATIQRWMEERGLRPTMDLSTGMVSLGHIGDNGGGVLQEITWGDFFAALEREELALVYQEESPMGEPSHWAKLVPRRGMPDEWME
jgi:hypothetical protein